MNCTDAIKKMYSYLKHFKGETTGQPGDGLLKAHGNTFVLAHVLITTFNNKTKLMF